MLQLNPKDHEINKLIQIYNSMFSGSTGIQVHQVFQEYLFLLAVPRRPAEGVRGIYSLAKADVDVDS